MTRTLVVEDDASKAQLIGFLLTHMGVTSIRTASSFTTGMKYAEEPFDIAILDYSLGDGNGCQLADYIATKSQGTKTIVYTAFKSRLPAEDQARVIEFDQLEGALLKVLPYFKKEIKPIYRADTDKYYRDELMAVTRQIACHDVKLENHTVRLDKTEKAVERIGDKIDALGVMFTNEIGELKPVAEQSSRITRIVAWVVSGVGLLLSIFCTLIGFKIWFK